MNVINAPLGRYFSKSDNNLVIADFIKFNLPKKIINNYKITYLDNIYKKNNHIRSFYFEANQQSLKFIDLISKRLFHNFNKKYSLITFKRLIRFFICDYIIYIKHIHNVIYELKKKHKNLKIISYQDLADIKVPNDYIEFNNWSGFSNGDFEYNHEMFANISEKFGIKVIRKNKKKLLKSKNSKQIKLIFNLLKNKLVVFIEKIFFKNIKFLAYGSQLPLLFRIKLFFKSNFQFYQLPYRRMQENHYKNNIRDDLLRDKIFKKSILFNDIENHYLECLKYFFPTCFLEDIKSIHAYSYKNFSHFSPSKIFSPHAWWADHAFVFWGSEISKSAKLVSGQHGGAYFLERHMILNENDHLNTDNYLVWNSMHKNYKNQKRIPSSLMINKLPFNLDKFKSPNKIFFFFTTQSCYTTRVIESFEKQIISSTKILNNILMPKYSKNLFVKLHMSDFGWNLKNYLLKNIPKLSFIDNTLNFDSISKFSYLNFFMYIGTTFFQSLALNIPSIIITTNNFSICYDYNSGYKNSYHLKDIKADSLLMIDHNLLFYDDEKFKRFINTVNIREWWSSERIQSLRSKILKKYFSVNANPIQEWINFINE